MGCSFLYGIPMRLLGVRGPAQPYLYDDPAWQGPEADIPPTTLFIARLIAMICAGIGLALIVYCFRWPVLAATVVFLAIPHVRADLARAWAEGPLLLGFGLWAISYGSRWFGPAAGLAASLKLTALALWPLLWVPQGKWTRPRVAAANPRGAAVVLAVAVWIATDPASWLDMGVPVSRPLARLPARAIHRSFGEPQRGAPRYVFPADPLPVALRACRIARHLLLVATTPLALLVSC